MTQRIRRFFAVTAAFGVLFALMPHAHAFTDVQSTTRYGTAIESLQQKGVVEGYADGSYGVDDDINRAEFLKIVLEARGTEIGAADDCFPDVDVDDWFSRYVCTGKDEGIVAGYPTGEFDPEKAVNFVEAAKIMTLAYGLEPQVGGEWYEPYALALDSSKAIPPTIAKLDAPLKRGEMAEIMWRIAEGRTDEEAKGYLNVKYPDAAVNFSSDDMQKAETCKDIEAMAQQAQSGGYGGIGIMRGFAEDSMAMPSMAPAKTGGDGGVDYSQTNVQVEGVDEADTTKTDGKFLYTISGQQVLIVRAQPATNMEITHTITFPSNEQPSELFVDNGTLVVIGNRWNNQPWPGPYPMPMEKMMAPMIYPPYWSTNETVVTTYDVDAEGKATRVRDVSFDGNKISTRMIDDAVYVVMNQNMYWPGPIMPMLKEDSLLPTFRDSAAGGEDMPIARCGDVMILPRVPSPQYLIVASIDVTDGKSEVKREVIVGDGQNVYASTDNLYVATTEWMYDWNPENPRSSERTHVYKFALNDGDVTYDERGTVDGRLLNQFSMDERESTFRLATTQGQSWDGSDPMSNNLFVLNAEMDTVGSIRDIAPGEQIYSVRFVGDRAYMVTFRTIDPLFVIGLSDPRNPEILGKLKIPGYSNYLHPYDEDHIIGFGKDAVESKDGSFAWYQGMKVALFDVSDVEHPKQLHEMLIGDRGTDSPLLYDHKALLFDRARNLLAFPVMVAKIADSQKTGEEGSAYGSPIFQGAHVYDISLDDGFDLRGTVSHYSADDMKKMGDVWWPSGEKDIQHVIRIEDSLYTISNSAIQAHTEDDVDLEGSVKLVQ